MVVIVDEVVNVVFLEFKKFLVKRKLIVCGNGFYEWVFLSGIVVKGCFIIYFFVVILDI